MVQSYEVLLKRLRDKLGAPSAKGKETRLEIPNPEVMWIGNKTIFRNFLDFPRLLRRDPAKILMFLAKELATAASLDGDRAIFIGRKDHNSFAVLIARYMKQSVLCPVCNSPDTREEKVKRMQFLVCEACGAKSPIKS